MRIAHEMVDEIVAHAREEAPNECCGMIGGRDGEATSLYRARNADPSPLRYTVDPRDQFRIMEQLDERGEELSAIYHSHTASSAEPSQTDINLARGWPDPLYAIVSVAEADSPVLRTFRITNGSVEEVPLDVR